MRTILLPVMLLLLFDAGKVYANRLGRQGDFVPRLVKRKSLPQTKYLNHGLFLARQGVFGFGKEQEKNLVIDWDWESAVENLFATFEPDKLAELAKIYGMADDNLATISKKNWLYRFMVNGNTQVADQMVEMGLDLDKVDLQVLLAYALQPNLERTTQVNWWEWLLKHGARIDDPKLITQLFKRAVLKDDIMLLDWMQTNLFADTDTAHKFLAQSLNEALQFAVRTGATEATVWLLKHGANANVLNEKDLLRAAMLGYVVDTGGVISAPLAQYVSKVDKSILGEMLYRITRDGVYKLSKQHILTIRHLQSLGAKLSENKLQETLHRSLTWHKRNWAMANWAIEHGANINSLDLNKLVRNAIKDWQVYTHNPKKLPNTTLVNIDALFDFFRMHDFDHNKLDVAQLLSEAEDNNFNAAIAQLNKVGEQVESVSTEEISQELYKELPPTATTTYADSVSEYFLLNNAIKEYLDKKSFIWLFLYIGKTRVVSPTINTLLGTDTLLEVIRLFPYGGSFIYNNWMNGLIASMWLAEEKEAVAQELLNRLFQSEEKQLFPFSFARWAVANGADINQPDQHAMMHAIINNEVMRLDHYRDDNLLLPSLSETFFFLQKNGFNFDTIDQQRILQETEALDIATRVLETLNKMRQRH